MVHNTCGLKIGPVCASLVSPTAPINSSKRSSVMIFAYVPCNINLIVANAKNFNRMLDTYTRLSGLISLPNQRVLHQPKGGRDERI
jgi:hypothetical protein